MCETAIAGDAFSSPSSANGRRGVDLDDESSKARWIGHCRTALRPPPDPRHAIDSSTAISTAPVWAWKPRQSVRRRHTRSESAIPRRSNDRQRSPARGAAEREACAHPSWAGTCSSDRRAPIASGVWTEDRRLLRLDSVANASRKVPACERRRQHAAWRGRASRERSGAPTIGEVRGPSTRPCVVVLAASKFHHLAGSIPPRRPDDDEVGRPGIERRVQGGELCAFVGREAETF